MKTKRILIYSGSAVLFCCLFVAKHSVLWSISLCALPLAVAFWLIIDQYPIILGLKTKAIKKSLILVTGVGITAYAAWLLEYAYGNGPEFFKKDVASIFMLLDWSPFFCFRASPLLGSIILRLFVSIFAPPLSTAVDW